MQSEPPFWTALFNDTVYIILQRDITLLFCVHELIFPDKLLSFPCLFLNLHNKRSNLEILIDMLSQCIQ